MKRILIMAAVAAGLACGAETVHYVTLEFKQVSYTLDIWQHVRNASNAFSITIPTTRRFYDSVSVGQELGGSFKTASFLTSGSLGRRKIVVARKFTKEEK